MLHNHLRRENMTMTQRMRELFGMKDDYWEDEVDEKESMRMSTMRRIGYLLMGITLIFGGCYWLQQGKQLDKITNNGKNKARIILMKSEDSGCMWSTESLDKALFLRFDLEKHKVIKRDEDGSEDVKNMQPVKRADIIQLMYSNGTYRKFTMREEKDDRFLTFTNLSRHWLQKRKDEIYEVKIDGGEITVNWMDKKTYVSNYDTVADVINIMQQNSADFVARHKDDKVFFTRTGKDPVDDEQAISTFFCALQDKKNAPYEVVIDIENKIFLMHLQNGQRISNGWITDKTSEILTHKMDMEISEERFSNFANSELGYIIYKNCSSQVEEIYFMKWLNNWLTTQWREKICLDTSAKRLGIVGLEWITWVHASTPDVIKKILDVNEVDYPADSFAMVADMELDRQKATEPLEMIDVSVFDEVPCAE